MTRPDVYANEGRRLLDTKIIDLGAAGCEILEIKASQAEQYLSDDDLQRRIIHDLSIRQYYPYFASPAASSAFQDHIQFSIYWEKFFEVLLAIASVILFVVFLLNILIRRHKPAYASVGKRRYRRQ